MDRGWTLADVPRRVSWRAVMAMVLHADRTAALIKVTSPNDAAWSVNDYLSALTVDLLSILVWQKTRDGQQSRNQPDPIPRPGEQARVEQLGNAAMTLDEVDQFLARRAAGYDR